MDRQVSQLYARTPRNHENNNILNKVQLNGYLSRKSPSIVNSGKGRGYLPQKQKGQEIKNLLKVLLVLEERILGATSLDEFQKAQINNMLSSIQSLIQSLSIQYSDIEMPNNACKKLITLIDSVENLVNSIISNNCIEESTKYGIFQDRISNLSPSVSSRSIGENYEDELVERTNGFHITRNLYNGYYDKDFLKESDDDDSEFDDEENCDQFTNGLADRYNVSHGKRFNTQNEPSQSDGPYKNARAPFSSFVTPTRSTIQQNNGFIEREAQNSTQSRMMHTKPNFPISDTRRIKRTSVPEQKVSNIYGDQRLLISQQMGSRYIQFPDRR